MDKVAPVDSVDKVDFLDLVDLVEHYRRTHDPIRYLPSLHIQFLCTVCTVICIL